MLHAINKEWYTCDRCGKEVNEMPYGNGEIVFRKGSMKCGARIDDIVAEATGSLAEDANDTITVRYFWWRGCKSKHLCRSCFKKYKKLLADFLKSEK